MKLNKLMILLIVVIGLLLPACGGSQAPSGPKKTFQPEWYGMETENDKYYFAYGNAEKTAQNMAEQAAFANGMAEAAVRVETQVKTMTKNFMSEAGVDNPEVTALTEQATKVIANQKFNGTQVTKRDTYTMENGRYKAFVQIGIPKADVNKALVDRVKKEEALYNRFRASQSFEELDKETSGK